MKVMLISIISVFFCRIECPVPVLDASSHPLGTKIFLCKIKNCKKPV